MIYHFGDFQLAVSRFELRRQDHVVKLERIPMDLLILLAERHGDVVTRPEIVERLWGKDLHVDTEHGINTAIRKIRAALGEDAEHPRYVHTVPGKGYRFAVDRVEAAPAPAPLQEVPSDVSPSATGTPTRPGRARLVVIAAAAAAAIIASIAVRALAGRDSAAAAPRPASIRSIAVLPLANRSQDRSQDYFADGMTDELITMLAKRTSLRVISSTSVMQYKGATRPLRDIARELGVDSVLEGSITKSSTGVHVTLQLIQASTDTHLWADSFDRDLDGAYALSSSIADTIAGVAGVAASRRAERHVTPAAHDAYLHGRYYWFADEYGPSQEYLEKAIQADPEYARAWAGLADVYAVRAVAGMVRFDTVIGPARAAAKRALDLDDTIAEAHNTLGALHLFYDWDFPAAEREAVRAIDLNPTYAEVHHLRSYVMMAMNRPAEAVREQRLATELDPFARPWALGFVLMHARDYNAAIDEFRLRSGAQPNERFTRLFLADCYRYVHRDREAAAELAEADRLFGAPASADNVLKAFERGGARAVAESHLASLQAAARSTYVSPLDLAHAYARLGRADEALVELDAAVRDRTPFLIFLQTEPDFDFLHGDPRYEDVVRRVGLAPDPPATH